MEEEWRDIKGYEGLYQISSFGRVKSLGNNKSKKEKILSGAPRKDSYLMVGLYKNGKGKSYTIHKLVALHFISNPNNYKEINHKDENKQNNRVDNLEWCTREYNHNYGTRTQRASEKSSTTQKRNGKNKGSKNSQARKVKCITTDKEFNCIKEAGECYKLTSSQIKHITDCCQGKRNYCGKHPVTGEKLKWKYIN